METFAFVLGFRYFLYLRKGIHDPISEGNRMRIIAGACIGAFVFSRLLGALEDPVAWWHSPHPLLYLFAAKTIVGALLGGLWGVECTKKWIGETHSSGDIFTWPLLLGMIIGRIGCFGNGVYEPTYGIETTFFAGMNLGDGLRRHPVTLYEILFLILLWAALYRLERGGKWLPGYRFRYFMIAYLTFRLCIDFIKPGVKFGIGLGSIQICCILGLIYYRNTILDMLSPLLQRKTNEYP